MGISDIDGLSDLPGPKKPRRRSVKRLVIGAVLAAIAVAAVVVNWPKNAEPGDVSATDAGQGADRARGAEVRLQRPFLHTPAAGWKDGIAGLRTPKPETMGSFSTKEVAAAIKAVVRTLQAEYLDRRVIEKHDFKPLLATLAPDAREDVTTPAEDPLKASLYAVLIDKSQPLLAAAPKVNGTMKVEPGSQPGELLVSVKISVAYAFAIDDPGRIEHPLDIVSLVRSDEEFAVYSGPHWERSATGVWPGESTGAYFSMACEELKRGYLAPAYIERALGPPPRHDDGYYFDPDNPISTENDCPA